MNTCIVQETSCATKTESRLNTTGTLRFRSVVETGLRILAGIPVCAQVFVTPCWRWKNVCVGPEMRLDFGERRGRRLKSDSILRWEPRLSSTAFGPARSVADPRCQRDAIAGGA